jgi:putative ABC transport system permease protein
MWWQTILLPLREIRRNLMRSTLTILGIVIGVASVITMVTLGYGANSKMTSYLRDFGSNLLAVEPGKVSKGGAWTPGKPFNYSDNLAIEGEIEGLNVVAPCATRGGTQAIYGDQNWPTTLTGSTNNYLTAEDWTVSTGRPFSDEEILSGEAVCIIGSTPNDKLFNGQDSIGETIRLNNISFQVIGVLKPKGNLMFGVGERDNFILIPLNAYQRRISGDSYVSYILISAKDGFSTEKIKSDINTLMRERRLIAEDKEDDFMIEDTKEEMASINSVLGAITAVLAAIAAISLLVGGIGIMNIMLVSVTERTREIGIRLAIGALERDVLKQFLLEAMVLTSFGGIIGIIFGLSATAIISHFLTFPFEPRPGIIIIAFMFSAVVGVVFGFFPARKAAMLDPIEALRHE